MIAHPSSSKTTETHTAVIEGDDSVTNHISDHQLSWNDLYISVVNLGYGKGGKNPVSELTTFYQPAKEIDLQVSQSSYDSKSHYNVGLIPQGTFLLRRLIFR